MLPPLVSSPSARLCNLFLRAALMSVLQSGGVVLLAGRSPYALATAFLISYQWSSNSRAIVDHRLRGSRVAYGLGGAAGCALTLWLTR